MRAVESIHWQCAESHISERRFLSTSSFDAESIYLIDGRMLRLHVHDVFTCASWHILVQACEFHICRNEFVTRLTQQLRVYSDVIRRSESFLILQGAPASCLRHPSKAPVRTSNHDDAAKCVRGRARCTFATSYCIQSRNSCHR